jgi:hypothetical protein
LAHQRIRLAQRFLLRNFAHDRASYHARRASSNASTCTTTRLAGVRFLVLDGPGLAQVASPLAGRRYDLRDAAVSLWLAAGVPPPRVAEPAGHSVEVLLRAYAKCLNDGEDIANTRIDAALRDA